MAPTDVTLACGSYDLTRGLQDGLVGVDGVRLNYLSLPPADIFWRMLRHAEFDASELSLSGYIAGLSKGDDRFVGLPVFPFRMFRHGYIFVRSDAGIESPADLRGRAVGVPEYHMTAALYIRGLLSDEYGVAPSDMAWFQGGQETPGREERIELNLAPDLRLQKIAPDATLVQMLEGGDLDALVSSRVPEQLLQRGVVRRLFADPQAEAVDYWRRTRIYPVMHLVVLRRDVYERNRWLAESLTRGFEAAHAAGVAELSSHAPASPLPFYRSHLESTLEAFGGPQIWGGGLASNRPALEAAVRYSYEQGLSARPVQVEELFAPEVLDRPVHG